MFAQVGFRYDGGGVEAIHNFARIGEKGDQVIGSVKCEAHLKEFGRVAQIRHHAPVVFGTAHEYFFATRACSRFETCSFCFQWCSF